MDPSSLAEQNKNTTGEEGSPAGGIGFLTGPLAKVLTVFAAALSIFTGPMLKLLGKLTGLAKKALGSVWNRLRGLLGGPKPKALPPRTTPPTPEPTPAPKPEEPGGVPEPVPEEITAPIPRDAPPPGQVIGEYHVVSDVHPVTNGTFTREIWGIRRLAGKTHDIKPIMSLMRTFTQEAKNLGATQLRIIGRAVVNKNIFKMEGLVKRMGGTFRKIDDMTVEIIIPVK